MCQYWSTSWKFLLHRNEVLQKCNFPMCKSTHTLYKLSGRGISKPTIFNKCRVIEQWKPNHKAGVCCLIEAVFLYHICQEITFFQKNIFIQMKFWCNRIWLFRDLKWPPSGVTEVTKLPKQCCTKIPLKIDQESENQFLKFLNQKMAQKFSVFKEIWHFLLICYILHLKINS